MQRMRGGVEGLGQKNGDWIQLCPLGYDLKQECRPSEPQLPHCKTGVRTMMNRGTCFKNLNCPTNMSLP